MNKLCARLRKPVMRRWNSNFTRKRYNGRDGLRRFVVVDCGKCTFLLAVTDSIQDDSESNLIISIHNDNTIIHKNACRLYQMTILMFLLRCKLAEFSLWRDKCAHRALIIGCCNRYLSQKNSRPNERRPRNTMKITWFNISAALFIVFIRNAAKSLK